MSKGVVLCFNVIEDAMVAPFGFIRLTPYTLTGAQESNFFLLFIHYLSSYNWKCKREIVLTIRNV